MITFGDVNDVASTSSTLGQLKGMGAGLGFERLQPETESSTTTMQATTFRASTESLVKELNQVSANTASVAADANATTKQLRETSQGYTGDTTGSRTLPPQAEPSPPPPPPEETPPPPLETFTPQGEITTLVAMTPIEEATPFYKKAWFWAAVGGGVVVLGAGGYFLLRKKRA